MSTKKALSLLEWASETFGDKAPSLVTLRRWARGGKIMPRPRKVGRDYHVTPGAKYINLNDPATLADQF